MQSNNNNQNTSSQNWNNQSQDNDKTLEDIQAQINELEATEKQASEQDQSEAKNNNADQKFNELNDKYLRLVAEFDNFKRRTKDDSFRLVSVWAVWILKSILPFFDNFQRAVSQCSDEIKNSEWGKGIFAIESSLVSELEKKWLSKIQALWAKFDANKMEALMQDPESPKDVVSKVLEEGFEFNWELVRVAKVVVGSKA